MQKILNKRLFRELRGNLMRYFALLLLIIMGMYVVVGIVGGAEEIIIGTTAAAEADLVEDGQFGVFIPLSTEQEAQLTASGATLERAFSVDVGFMDEKTLRVFKNRERVNLIHVENGRMAEAGDEILLEKRFCEENSISVGDKITLCGEALTVVGIGSTPDYDMLLKSFADVTAESSTFGTAFVTSERYDKLLSSNTAATEDYCYAYRLNGTLTDSELKSGIKELEFDYTKVEDKYFREQISEITDKEQELRDGTEELLDGSTELYDGLTELDENSDTLSDGAEQIFTLMLANANSELAASGITELLTKDNYAEALDKYIAATKSIELASLKATLDKLRDFADGTAKYTDGVGRAAEGSRELNDGVSELKTETDRLLDELFKVDIDNLTSFIKADENARIGGAAGDMVMNKQMGLISGVIVMTLFTYVISVFVIHQIQSESSVIGTLYALGVKKRNLTAHYLTIPVLITFVGGVIGTLLGLILGSGMQESYAYFSIPLVEKVYPIYLIIYGIVMPPVVCALVNLFVVNKKLSQTALSLIRNEQSNDSHSRVTLKDKSFIRSFRIRQMLRESRTGITVVAGMLISLLIFMLGIDCYFLCDNVKKDMVNGTRFNYMYMLKYPEAAVPKEAEPCYSEALSKTSFGFTLDVTIMGIDSDNKYFDYAVPKGKSRVVISETVKQKYGLSAGEKLILTDSANELDYAFTIDSVCGYSSGLTVFMDIDSMRELFGQKDDYYNMLLSDDELQIDSGRVYSITTRADVERASGVFTDMMMPMVITITAVSIIIFCVVMYLMMNVMIDRAGFGISLIKIFGFRTGEIRRLYLDGNMYIVGIGAIICIPIAKVISDSLYPWLIANTSCGMNLAMPWYMYPLIFVGVMVIYFIVNALLVGKLKRISPAEVLKNRE